MESSNYQQDVEDLMQRLQSLQTEYISRQDDTAQLVGPLVAITMLVKSDLIPFARDRYRAIVKGHQWKIAEDHILGLRSEVEAILAGPSAYDSYGQKQA